MNRLLFLINGIKRKSRREMRLAFCIAFPDYKFEPGPVAAAIEVWRKASGRKIARAVQAEDRRPCGVWTEFVQSVNGFDCDEKDYINVDCIPEPSKDARKSILGEYSPHWRLHLSYAVSRFIGDVTNFDRRLTLAPHSKRVGKFNTRYTDYGMFALSLHLRGS